MLLRTLKQLYKIKYIIVILHHLKIISYNQLYESEIRSSSLFIRNKKEVIHTKLYI